MKLEISGFNFFQAAQPLNPAFLRMIESIRAPPRTMILIFFLLKVNPPLW
jgi:hypothetical protein